MLSLAFRVGSLKLQYGIFFFFLKQELSSKVTST